MSHIFTRAEPALTAGFRDGGGSPASHFPTVCGPVLGAEATTVAVVTEPGSTQKVLEKNASPDVSVSGGVMAPGAVP